VDSGAPHWRVALGVWRANVRLACACLLMVATAACHQAKDALSSGRASEGKTDNAMRGAAGLRIIFGHQSVGFDILAGVADLEATAPAHGKLEVTLSTSADALDRPALVHFQIGRNGDPYSKLDAWRRYVTGGLGSRADLAMFKFCFDDIAADTDIDRLFAAYRMTVEDLQDRFPGTVFVHVTIPLTTLQGGVKGAVKRVLGRPVGEELENVRREAFNDRLRAQYRGRAPLFDLAAFEAEWPDGRVETFSHDGARVRALAPIYTVDGGHLNALGRTRMAARFLEVVADQVRVRAEARVGRTAAEGF
jgi:hypothetical protein